MEPRYNPLEVGSMTEIAQPAVNYPDVLHMPPRDALQLGVEGQQPGGQPGPAGDRRTDRGPGQQKPATGHTNRLTG